MQIELFFPSNIAFCFNILEVLHRKRFLKVVHLTSNLFTSKIHRFRVIVIIYGLLYKRDAMGRRRSHTICTHHHQTRLLYFTRRVAMVVDHVHLVFVLHRFLDIRSSGGGGTGQGRSSYLLFL